MISHLHPLQVLGLAKSLWPHNRARNEPIALAVGISDPNPTLLNNDVLTEDNGWPNVEARAAWAVGALQQEGLAAQRPFDRAWPSIVAGESTRRGASRASSLRAKAWARTAAASRRRLANEFTYRTTDYLALADNDGFGYHWQMQWKF